MELCKLTPLIWGDTFHFVEKDYTVKSNGKLSCLPFRYQNQPQPTFPHRASPPLIKKKGL